VGGNVDIVRRAFDAFSRRDAAALAELVDPDFEWTSPTAGVAGRLEPYRGHQGLKDYLADVARVWQELRSEPEEFFEVGDRVVVVGRIYAWGVGRVVDAPAGWVLAAARRADRRGPRVRQPPRRARRGRAPGRGLNPTPPPSGPPPEARYLCGQ
jgi:ketosteroid isomerase-like protein